MDSKFIGLSALFRGLSDQDRAQALSLLSSLRYAPHLEALPDVFSIVPEGATQDQQDNIIRGLMSAAAAHLASGKTPSLVQGDDGRYEEELVAGDLPGITPASLRGRRVTFTLPPPILSAVSLIRHKHGGAIPDELVGLFNGMASPTGDYAATSFDPDSPSSLAYLSGDDGAPLEGGFLSKIKNIASKAASVANVVTSNPITRAVASVIPGGSLVMQGLDIAKGVMGSGLGQAALGALSGAADPKSLAGGLLQAGMGLASGKSGAVGQALSTLSSKGVVSPSTVNAATKLAAGASILATPPKSAASTAHAGLSFGKVLSDPDKLLDILDETFGKEKVNDAFLHILAAEGDFISDVMSGNVLSGPSAYQVPADMSEGDWTETAKNLIWSTTEALNGAVANTKKAGSSAFSKLDPKTQAFLGQNWGKIAAGTGGIAAAAALYLGASKIMKDRDAKAKLRILQAKREAAELAAAKQKASLEKARAERKQKQAELAAKPSKQPDTEPTPSAPPALPPLDPNTVGLPPLPAGSGASGSPSGMTVEATYLKIPFAGSILSDLEGSGSAMFNSWRKSLLSVNPTLLTGDLPFRSYEDFGAVFITHGFPLDAVTVITRDMIPDYESHRARRLPLTSPNLTRAIISAALRATDPKAKHDDIMVKSGARFVPFDSLAFTPKTDVFKLAGDARMRKHMPRKLRNDLDTDTASSRDVHHFTNAAYAIDGKM